VRRPDFRLYYSGIAPELHEIFGFMALIKNKRSRRLLALALVVAGGLLIWLAPETAPGIALLVAGVILEIAGIALERRAGG
jgi:hypothetical protein